MMNSTNENNDEFGANPFRSNDVFYDASDAQQQQPQPPPPPPPQSFQPSPAFNQQQQPPQQQQSFGSSGSNDPFQPQPVNNFPAPSGPMNAPPSQQQQQFQQQQQQQQQPSGLMSPQPMSPQQQQQQPPQQPTSWWGNLSMCLSLDSYKMYFDIDADDIVSRIRGVFLHFFKPEHFRNNVVGATKTDALKGPDLYGPFWITMTMIFILGVTANFHAYVHHTTVVHKNNGASGGTGNSTVAPASTQTAEEEEFDYDINHLLNAAYICCGFAFVLPTILWMTTQCCMGMKALTLAEWVCLYGYSLVPYLPVTVLCIIPFGIVSWVFLAVATAASCLLVVRNVSHPLLANDVGQAKAPPIILVILGTHIVFFLFLKFSFYHHAG